MVDDAADARLALIEASLTKLLEALGSESATRIASGILQPDVLAAAQPPEFWSARFAARGLRMSARALRAKALKAALCYHVDKKVLISPKQIDELFLWRGSSSAKPVASQRERSRGAGRAYERAKAKLLALKEERKAKNRAPKS